MTSPELNMNETEIHVKRHRAQRACDACRQRRGPCDGLRNSSKKCTHCAANNLECTFSGAPAKVKGKSYTEALEERLAAMQKLLDKYSEPQITSGARTPTPIPPRIGLEFASMSIRLARDAEGRPRDPEELIVPSHLMRWLESTETPTGSTRQSCQKQFLGESSGHLLVNTTMGLRNEQAPQDQQAESSHIGSEADIRTWQKRDYWHTKPWSTHPPGPDMEKPKYIFPPPALLASLVNLYFTHVNVYIPLLHRPIFEKLIATSVHFGDHKFAATVLLVCAVGARYSDDQEVWDEMEPQDPEAEIGADGDEMGRRPLTSGWKYFRQVSMGVDGLYDTPVLFDLQRYCLAIQFLEGWETESTWAHIGIGIRIAQGVGAHRRQPDGPHTVEAELWRRAFWTLVYYDRTVSCALGRPAGLLYDDFDVQLPTEVDDPHWKDRQPLAVPSRVVFFNTMVKLTHILAWVLRFLYSLDKKNALYESGSEQWKEDLVVELDSALNEWVDAIPQHLRWDPNSTDVDPIFFKQSAVLYCAYYQVQITIHRPFIHPTAPTASETHRLPSLAICTAAARSCARIAEVWMTRLTPEPPVMLVPALAIAGIVLLLSGWQKRASTATTTTTVKEGVRKQVHQCMEAIRACESRWRSAGALWDILNGLADVNVAAWPSSISNVDGVTSGSQVPWHDEGLPLPQGRSRTVLGFALCATAGWRQPNRCTDWTAFRWSADGSECLRLDELFRHGGSSK
ncbi:fungal-specific transcription factor domain-containing protein [Mycena amicta]|nr:fungal-specific transcription factor domain-containing protein [Mycena amicta]